MPYDYKRLKAAREGLGITQTELAERMGVTKQAVNYIEQGVRQSPPSIKLYADIVGISLKLIVISDEEFVRLRGTNGANGHRSKSARKNRRTPAGAKATPKRPKRR